MPAASTRPLGLNDLKEPAYFAGVINLSDKLAQKLKEMKAARASGGALLRPGSSRHISWRARPTIWKGGRGNSSAI